MKVIKISNCGGCPHSYIFFDALHCKRSHSQYCGDTIPDWCKLEEEQDLTPALELLQGLEDCVLWVRSTGLVICDKAHNEIASGKTIRDLLVNLVKKEGK